MKHILSVATALALFATPSFSASASLPFQFTPDTNTSSADITSKTCDERRVDVITLVQETDAQEPSTTALMNFFSQMSNISLAYAATCNNATEQQKFRDVFSPEAPLDTFCVSTVLFYSGLILYAEMELPPLPDNLSAAASEAIHATMLAGGCHVSPNYNKD